MIELIVEDYCHSCPEFEPDVYKKSDTYYTENLFLGIQDYMTVCETVIRCAHRDRCQSMTQHIKRELKKEK